MGKGGVMRRIITILLFFNLGIAQDVYPYFMEPNKQFQFEQDRIYVKEVEEKLQYISGGEDEFNPWWLLFSNAPMYKATALTTSFYYEYTFEIIKNGKLLNEVEFLHAIGVEEKAKQIIDANADKIAKYQQELVDFNAQPYYIKESVNPLFAMMVIGGFVVGARILDDSSKNKKIGTIGLLSGTSGAFLAYRYPLKQKIPKPRPEEPVIKQYLTNDQIKSLAESYNRGIYAKILNEKIK